MKGLKRVLFFLILGLAAAVASHKALTLHPVNMLVVSSDGRQVEAYRLELLLNGREPRVEPIRFDAEHRRWAVDAVMRSDRKVLSQLARATGDFRFHVALKGTRSGWPWYLGGDPQTDDSVSNLNWLDKRYLSLVAGSPAPPAYQVASTPPPEPRKPGSEPSILSMPDPKPSERPTPMPATLQAVKVEILNDCGIKGAADVIARAVERPGIDIVFVGNAPRYRYRSTRFQSSVGVPVVLQEILEQMGIPESTVEKVPAGRRKADVTLIVGRDYRKILERMNARTSE